MLKYQPWDSHALESVVTRRSWSFCVWPSCRFLPEDDVPLCDYHARQVFNTVKAWPADRDGISRTLADQERLDQKREDALKTKRSQWGQIYYIRLNDVIKIGWTSHLYGRLIDYSPGAVLLAHHAGTRADERDLHRSFAPLRVHGREWHNGSAQIILDHIEAMLAEHGPPTVKLQMHAPSQQSGKRPRVKVTAARAH